MKFVLLLLLAIPAAALAQTWETIPPMSVPRAEVRSAVLPNGKILVIGGRNTLGAVGTCELYDPFTNTWSLAGDLNVPRFRFSLEKLPDGRIVVSGGLVGSVETTETREVFDPSTGQWTLAADLLDGRQNFPSVVTPDGNVMYSGGMNSNSPVRYLNSAELYDAQTDIVRELAPMPISFYGNTLLYSAPLNGVIATGGLLGGTGGNYLRTTILFDFNDSVWTYVGDLAEPHANGVGQDLMLEDGSMLMVSGRTGQTTVTTRVERFDEIDQRWETLGHLIRPHWHAKTLQIGIDSILTIGGLDDPDFYRNHLRSTSWFNFRTKTSSAGPLMNEARAYFAASKILRSVIESPCEEYEVVYVFGGEGLGGELLNTCERLVLPKRGRSNRFAVQTPLPILETYCDEPSVKLSVLVTGCGAVTLKQVESIRGNAIQTVPGLPLAVELNKDFKLSVTMSSTDSLITILKLKFDSPAGEIIKYVHVNGKATAKPDEALSTPEAVVLTGNVCEGPMEPAIFVNHGCEEITVTNIVLEGGDSDFFDIKSLPKLPLILQPKDSLFVWVSGLSGIGSDQTTLSVTYSYLGDETHAKLQIESQLAGNKASRSKTLINDQSLLTVGDTLFVPVYVIQTGTSASPGFSLSVAYNSDNIVMIEPDFKGAATQLSGVNLQIYDGGASITTPSDLTIDPSRPLVNLRFKSFLSKAHCAPLNITSLIFSPYSETSTECVQSSNLDSALLCFKDLCSDPTLRAALTESDKEGLSSIQIGNSYIHVDYFSIVNPRFEVFDLLGRMRMSWDGQGSSHRLTPGSYVLRMQVKDRHYSRRFIYR